MFFVDIKLKLLRKITSRPKYVIKDIIIITINIDKIAPMYVWYDELFAMRKCCFLPRKSQSNINCFIFYYFLLGEGIINYVM